MRYGALVASLAFALALTASGQRGASHGGFSGHGSSGGHGGFAGHGGFTGHTGSRGSFGGAQHFGPSGFRGNSVPFAPSGFRGMSQPFAPSGFRGNAPVASPYSGRFGSPVFRGSVYGSHSGHRMPYGGRSDYGNHQRGGDHRRGWDRDRDHHRWNGAGYFGSYAYGGPRWYSPYPFVVDPGFYDWGDSEYDQSNGYAYSPNDPGPQYEQQEPPAEEYEPTQPAPRPAYAPGQRADSQGPQQQSSAASFGTQHSLTVIFKNGRAPETIGNYMVNSKTLTDLDQDHYEEIPIDQIDVAATEQSNRVHGLHFEVPGTVRD